MPILSMQGVTHLYNEGMPSESKAIDNINLDIEEGELVVPPKKEKGRKE